VPTGIYYTEKQTFRSSVLIVFGPPIAVRAGAVGEPPREDVEQLTAQIQSGLDAVTLQADSHAVLDLVARAESIFSGGQSGDLAYQLDLRRRFVGGYRYLREHDPARIAQFAARIERFEADMDDAGLELESLMTPTSFVARGIIAVLLLPLAIAGALLHVVPYLLIALLARLFARDAELRATVKIVAAIVFYPMTWLAYFFVHPWLPLIAPVLGYIALRDFEELADVYGRLRGRTSEAARLVKERTAIRADMAAIADEMTRQAAS